MDRDIEEITNDFNCVNNEIFTKSEHRVSLINLNTINGEYSIINMTMKNSDSFDYNKIFSDQIADETPKKTQTSGNLTMFRNFTKSDYAWIIIHHYSISSFSLNHISLLWEVEYSKISNSHKKNEMKFVEKDFLLMKNRVVCLNLKGKEEWSYNFKFPVHEIFRIEDDKTLIKINPIMHDTSTNRVQILREAGVLFADYWNEPYKGIVVIKRREIAIWCYLTHLMLLSH